MLTKYIYIYSYVMVLIYNGRKNKAKMQWINHVPDSKLQSCQVCTTNSTTEKHPFPKNDKNHYLNWSLTYNIRHLINVCIYIYMYIIKKIIIYLDIHIYHIPLFPHTPKKEKNWQPLKTTCNPSTCHLPSTNSQVTQSKGAGQRPKMRITKPPRA